MSKRWRRWTAAGVVVAVLAAGAGSAPVMAQNGTGRIVRAVANVASKIVGLAGLLGGGDAAIIANQVTQIGHMVSQITEMQNLVADTNELLTSNTYPMGHIGRLREIREQDFYRRYLKNGLAQSTALGAPEGLYSARVIGQSDEPGWLNILSAPRLGDPTSNTVLLGGRPATETNPAEPSAFRTWPVPSGGAWSNPARNAAREAIDILGDVAEGTATWRTVWDDIEMGLPPAVRAADLRALRLGTEITTRLIGTWRRRERQAAADLQHAHAIAEAASTLNAQVGETAAHLGELRDDDLMGEERIDQAKLSNGVTQTELLLAQAQLRAQEQAAAARRRYDAERARREAMARWQARMAEDRDALDRADAAEAASASRLDDSLWQPAARTW